MKCGDDPMEVVAAAALGAAPLNVRAGAQLVDDMRDVGVSSRQES